MSRAITLAALEDESQFYQGEHRGYLTAAVKDRLTGEKWGEADGTAALAAAVGAGANLVIGFILDAAGLPRAESWTYQLRSRADLYVGQHRVQTFGQNGPDVFVIRRSTDDDGESPMWDPVVAVEVKRWSAHWNGHPEACPSGLHRDYGAQMFCYPAGCWMKPISRSRVAVRYLWLAPERAIEKFRDTTSSLVSPTWDGFEWDFVPELKYLERMSRERLWATATIEKLLSEFDEAGVRGTALQQVVAGLLA